MEIDRETMLRAMRQNARAQVARLAGELVRSGPGEKESVLAALEFECWLAETCDVCLDRSHERAL